MFYVVEKVRADSYRLDGWQLIKYYDIIIIIIIELACTQFCETWSIALFG